MPKVSILVPIYNVERYLKQCLESLVNQTLQDIEIICINDGSTDASHSIIEEYAKNDNRIKAIHKDNSGYGHSMNTGLDAVTGEFVAIVESDDFVDLNMCKDLYELAQKDDVDMVIADFYGFKNNQARKMGKVSKSLENKIINVQTEKKITKLYLPIWNKMYKTEFLKEINLRFIESKGASYQDTSFGFISLVSAKKVVCTQRAYLYYREDNANSSVKQKDKVFCVVEEYQKITNFLNENEEIKKAVNCEKLIRQYNGYMWNLMRIEEEFYAEFIDVFSNQYNEFYKNGEITEGFYKKIDKAELKMLLANKVAFQAMIKKRAKSKNKKETIKDLFSIRINSSRVSIVLFGKQIIKLGS